MFKYTTDKDGQEHLSIEKPIQNTMILNIGSTGAGKSVFADLIATTLQEQYGYTIIIITTKKGSERDHAYPNFPPNTTEQIQKIKAQEEKIPTTRETKDSVITYHPLNLTQELTRNHTQPKTTFYSQSIKNLTENSLSCLLKGDEDSESVNTLLRTIKKINNNEDWNDTIWKLKNTKDNNQNTPYPIRIENDKSTITRIIKNTEALEENPILQPENSTTNLNMKEIINNNKQRHLFSTEWIDNTRIRYLATMMIPEAIKKEIDKGNNNKPILLIFEEIQNQIPKENDKRQSYQEQLLKTIDNLMAIVRGQNVSILLTSQNLTRTPKEITSLAETWFIFRPSQNDIRYMFKSEDIDKGEKSIIGQTSRGEFIYYKRTKQKQWIENTILAYVPRHAIQQEGQKYKELYKKYYPEDMINYTKQIQEWKTIQEQMNTKGINKNKKIREEEKIQERQIEQETQEEEELEKEIIKQQITKQINTTNIEQEIAYTLKTIITEQKQGLIRNKSTWTELTKRMNQKGTNKNRITLKKIAIRKLTENKDTETIEYLNKN